MKTNETETETVNTSSAPAQVTTNPHAAPASACADRSPTNPIPQQILDHAERCYPTASRPKCPIYARNFDREKQHCIDNRQKIEAELAAQNCPQTEPTPSTRTPSPTQKSASPQSQISNLKSEIPTISHLPKTHKHPDFPLSPASSRQNLSKTLKVGRPATAVIPGAPVSVQLTPHNQSHIERATISTPQLPSVSLANSKSSIRDSQSSISQPASIPAQPVHNKKGSRLHAQCPTPPSTQSQISNLKFDIPTPNSNSTLTLARVLQSAATRKARPDDKIAHLSDDDRQQLIDWLNHMSYDAVVELAAQPRPQGLDLPTSRAALQRFYAKHDLNDRLQQAIDILETVAPAPGAPNPLEQTLELLVHAQATRSASQPIQDRVLPHFLRHITRLRDLQLRDRAITLRQKALAFRMQTQGYDLVAQTMRKLPELNEIATHQNLTPRQSMDKAFIKVFGQETSDFIQQSNRQYTEQNPNEPDCDPVPDETCLETELTTTEKYWLMHEFPDTPWTQIKVIADERRANGQPITANPEDIKYF